MIAAGHFQSPVCLSFRVTPLLKTLPRWCRNIDLTVHRLRLSASA